MAPLLQGSFFGLEPSPVSAAGSSWDQRRRLWWLLWSRCPGLGWVRLNGLEFAFGSLEAAWSAPSESLASLPGWSTRLLLRVESFRNRWGPRPLLALQQELRGGRAVLLPGDRGWPPAMAALSRPPLGLYWQGRGSLWRPLGQRRAVAVVGTRRPSPHGLAMATSIGLSLARAGWPVVSGLAEGIDGAAHRGCLDGGGCPVGVLGTPLGRSYPLHHAALQARVGKLGLLTTEHHPGATVLAGHFASRNRLLVALAAAVVVVECPLASGALHSAELAWKEELPLWVVPADADRPSAAGSNRLLTQGATPLLSAADLIAALGSGPLKPSAMPSFLAGDGATPWQATPQEHKLLEAVGHGASLDTLCGILGRQAEELADELLRLELRGLLKAEAGLHWRPTSKALACDRLRLVP